MAHWIDWLNCLSTWGDLLLCFLYSVVIKVSILGIVSRPRIIIQSRVKLTVQESSRAECVFKSVWPSDRISLRAFCFYCFRSFWYSLTLFISVCECLSLSEITNKEGLTYFRIFFVRLKAFLFFVIVVLRNDRRQYLNNRLFSRTLFVWSIVSRVNRNELSKKCVLSIRKASVFETGDYICAPWFQNCFWTFNSFSFPTSLNPYWDQFQLDIAHIFCHHARRTCARFDDLNTLKVESYKTGVSALLPSKPKAIYIFISCAHRVLYAVTS